MVARLRPFRSTTAATACPASWYAVARNAALLLDFLAYDVATLTVSVVRGDLLWTSGVRVAVTAGNDGIANIVTAAGPLRPPLVRIFQPPNQGAIDNFFAYDPLFTAGVFVGGNA